MNKKPIVSICMITYNHEKYITQAIEGVMMQQTNFSYQLILAEDYSTDNTLQICKRYEKLYPEKIKLLPQPNKNLGLMPNFLRTLNACTGKYIAICEGDDFWTDPMKLQKQVDFLEINSQYCGVCHNVSYSHERIETINKSGVKKTLNTNKREGLLSVNEILTANPVHSSAVLYRKSGVVLPDYYHKIRLHDEFLFLIICKSEVCFIKMKP